MIYSLVSKKHSIIANQPEKVVLPSLRLPGQTSRLRVLHRAEYSGTWISSESLRRRLAAIPRQHHPRSPSGGHHWPVASPGLPALPLTRLDHQQAWTHLGAVIKSNLLAAKISSFPDIPSSIYFVSCFHLCPLPTCGPSLPPYYTTSTKLEVEERDYYHHGNRYRPVWYPARPSDHRLGSSGDMHCHDPTLRQLHRRLHGPELRRRYHGSWPRPRQHCLLAPGSRKARLADTSFQWMGLLFARHTMPNRLRRGMHD